jgi:hypothetical protein
VFGVVSVAEWSASATVATSASAEAQDQEVSLMIPLDYHRGARLIANERIAAGEAAARHTRNHPATEPFPASLLAAVLSWSRNHVSP